MMPRTSWLRRRRHWPKRRGIAAMDKEFKVGDVVTANDQYSLPSETILRSNQPSKHSTCYSAVFQLDSWGDAQEIGLAGYVDCFHHFPATIIWLPPEEDQDGAN